MPNRPTESADLIDVHAVAPTSRVYVHEKCNRATEVTDGDFAALANPAKWRVTHTMCPGCSIDRLRNFYWQDTGEWLDEFRDRVWRRVPWWIRGMPYGGAIAAGLVAWVIGRWQDQPGTGNRLEIGMCAIAGLWIFWAIRFLFLPDFRKFV